MPLVVCARQLRTPRQLAVEVARLLSETARVEARDLVAARKTIPAGVDLFSRLVYAHAQPMIEAQKAADRARSRAAFDSELRQQRKVEQARAKEVQRDDTVPTRPVEPDADRPARYERRQSGTARRR